MSLKINHKKMTLEELKLYSEEGFGEDEEEETEDASGMPEMGADDDDEVETPEEEGGEW